MFAPSRAPDAPAHFGCRPDDFTSVRNSAYDQAETEGGAAAKENGRRRDRQHDGRALAFRRGLERGGGRNEE